MIWTEHGLSSLRAGHRTAELENLKFRITPPKCCNFRKWGRLFKKNGQHPCREIESTFFEFICNILKALILF